MTVRTWTALTLDDTHETLVTTMQRAIRMARRRKHTHATCQDAEADAWDTRLRMLGEDYPSQLFSVCRAVNENERVWLTGWKRSDGEGQMAITCIAEKLE